MLITAGADLEARQKDKMTALHVACEASNYYEYNS